ncbi:MAG: hypothetical protein COT81_03475 [Candidatus Buchananbacteria bacterium CG10_big_fil_rev_8_21_14_0_10_42_9]|uniref:Nudix hydrolase domain-containing protein n=1 Tax=Candidatus Buchananbacteria bacterium CG10_big_fil_rev_8_21_14_0_10_42_9 TaxID=1974526 RepID=A0A2H0W117_9BACT|nr:MAG: hypothetical protein COT81_03475 [Candidatus Buchananbacteria bacterium CG10_big_fil_rev_8_21_14_0_10_42_9]
MKNEKREIAVLIPYKIENGEVHVFLQKRSEDAKRLPDHFGFFGGGAKVNETVEEAMLREIKEELNYKPKKYTYLGHFDFSTHSIDAFYFESPDDFENDITIIEGDYGKYFTDQEALDEPKLIDEDKVVLRSLFKNLQS